MKRRQFIQSAIAGVAAGAGLELIGGAVGKIQPGLAQSADSLSIQWLGHSCFLFRGSGLRILVNPFRPLGCTAGYRAPRVEADLVLISSRLLDEGVVDGLPGSPRVLFEPGVFEFRGIQLQGIRTPHDDLGGRRFGTNVVWRWRQGGINVLHMGGAAAPITTEQQILMGRPDVAMIPVGNGPKVFTPEEAQAAIQRLRPKMVFPTQFRTEAADANACDLLPIDNFLTLMQGTPVRRVGSDTVTVRSSALPAEGTEIQLLTYRA